MKILGIRTSPTTVRYAVLESDGKSISLLNRDTENKLVFPASRQNAEEKLHWLHQEINRILRNQQDIEKVMIKASEYGRGRESASSREAACLDGVVLLTARENSLPVEVLLYRNIGTRRGEVKDFSENKVGRSNKYWNEQMADAIAAAWTGR